MRKDPRVADVGSLVGSNGPVGGTQVTNVASLSVTLKPGVIGNQAQRFVTQWTAALTGSRSASRSRTRHDVVHARADRSSMRARLRKTDPGLQVFGRTDRHRPEHHLARSRRAADSNLRSGHQQALQSRRVYGDSEASDGDPRPAAASARHHERAARDRRQRRSRRWPRNSASARKRFRRSSTSPPPVRPRRSCRSTARSIRSRSNCRRISAAACRRFRAS